MDSTPLDDVADAFDPLPAGIYPGGIAPGAFVGEYERNGNRHGTLGLKLVTGVNTTRIVRAHFLIDSPTAFVTKKRDVAVLVKWVELIGCPAASGWANIVKSLCLGAKLNTAALQFDIERNTYGRGYVVRDVTPVIATAPKAKTRSPA
jgi:hypothetical protein